MRQFTTSSCRSANSGVPPTSMAWIWVVCTKSLSNRSSNNLFLTLMTLRIRLLSCPLSRYLTLKPARSKISKLSILVSLTPCVRQLSYTATRSGSTHTSQGLTRRSFCIRDLSTPRLTGIKQDCSFQNLSEWIVTSRLKLSWRWTPITNRLTTQSWRSRSLNCRFRAQATMIWKMPSIVAAIKAMPTTTHSKQNNEINSF